MYYIYEKLRDERKLSDYRVSKDTGIPKSTIASWRTGKSAPRLDNVMRLANYFDVPLSVFINGMIGNK